jgi:hypothetical protein
MLFAGGQTGLERRDGSVVGVGLMQHFFQPHDFKEIKYKLYELHNLYKGGARDSLRHAGIVGGGAGQH